MAEIKIAESNPSRTPVVFLYALLFRQNWVIIDIAGVLSSADTADDRVTGMGILDVKINRNAV